MKEEFHKDTDILRGGRIKWKFWKWSVSQVKNSVEWLSSRMDQIMHRISGFNDKVCLLDGAEDLFF
jgi:hypothetical protein